ncbi:MAG: lysoplasmalogenase [Acidobacteriota bacterium]|nr:MAG: lysoplasmalogenase [Acidobacteriota bacterium]
MGVGALTFGRVRNFGKLDRYLLYLSIASSLAYYVTSQMPRYPGRFMVKGLAVGALSALAFHALRGQLNPGRVSGFLRDRDNVILGTSLAFSCMGDMYLDLGSGTYFIQGLVSFLIAHFIYILLFVCNWKRPLRPTWTQLMVAGLVLLYSLFFANWLAPDLGDLANPVMIYLCTITAMVVTAIFAGFSRPWVWIGAVLFLISDSIIAAEKFKTDVPLNEYLVWATYYPGQYCIALGYLKEKLGVD